jgi:tRNA(fMet)-specific endonuclease VapC
MKCLDTDLLVAILRGREDAELKMNEVDREGRQCTTAITAFELFYGAYKSKQRHTNLEKTRMVLERVDVLSLDYESSEGAGEILADLAARGDMIDFRDAMIAGIAKAKGLTLVTRNEEHFARVKGLKVEVW